MRRRVVLRVPADCPTGPACRWHPLLAGSARDSGWHGDTDSQHAGNLARDAHASCNLGFRLITGGGTHLNDPVAQPGAGHIYLVCLLSLSAWQLSAAIRRPEQGRWRLAAVGVYFGLAMGVNWVAISLFFLAVAAFFVARLSAGRRRLMTSKRGIPVPGISLIEAIVWLGVVPLLIYAAATLAGISG